MGRRKFGAIVVVEKVVVGTVTLALAPLVLRLVESARRCLLDSLGRHCNRLLRLHLAVLTRDVSK